MSALTMVPGKTDKEIADDLRKRTIEAMVPVLAIMDEARAQGFTIGFQLGEDGLKRNVVQALSIIKSY